MPAVSSNDESFTNVVQFLSEIVTRFEIPDIEIVDVKDVKLDRP